jgi:hypothetical protein
MVPVGSTERSVLPSWLLVLALSLRVLPTIQRLVAPSLQQLAAR